MDRETEIEKLENAVEWLQQILDSDILSMYNSNAIFTVRNECMERIRYLKQENEEKETVRVDIRNKEIMKLTDDIENLKDLLNFGMLSAEKGKEILDMIDSRKARLEYLKKNIT